MAVSARILAEELRNNQASKYLPSYNAVSPRSWRFVPEKLGLILAWLDMAAHREGTDCRERNSQRAIITLEYRRTSSAPAGSYSERLTRVT